MHRRSAGTSWQRLQPVGGGQSVGRRRRETASLPPSAQWESSSPVAECHPVPEEEREGGREGG